MGNTTPPNVITATGTVTVFPSATLAGFSTLKAPLIVNNGLVTPGNVCGDNTPATLTFDGNYTQTSIGTLQIHAVDAASHDLLVVQNGAVNLDGTLTFINSPSGNLFVGDKILVLDNSTGAGITGGFSSLIAKIPPHLTASIVYDDPHQAFVLIGPCPPDIPPSITTYANLSIPLMAMTTEHMEQLQQRMLNIRQLLPCLICNDQYAKEGSSYRKPCHPLSLYGAVLANIGELEAISTQNEQSFRTLGGLVGMNYAFYQGGIGVELGYEKTHARIHEDWGKYEISSVFGAIYGTIIVTSLDDPLFIDLAVEGWENWYSIHRNIDASIATGKPESWQWDAFVDIGYDLMYKMWTVTPLASLEYIRLHIDEYTEKGAGDDNSLVSKQNYRSFRAWLGLSIKGNLSFGQNGIVQPEFRGFWIRDFADQEHKVHITSLAFETSSTLPVFGAGHNFGLVGEELRFYFGPSFSIAQSYDFYWNNHFQAHLLYGELALHF